MSKYLALLVSLIAAMFSSAALKADEADEATVRGAIDIYVQAFNKKDLKAVAAMWAKNGIHTDRETGERTEGRDAIQADIAATFKTRPAARISARVDRVRFIKPDVASIEGQATSITPGDEPAVTSYSAILVNENNTWLIHSIEEMPAPQPSTPYDALKELEWLVGRWVDDSEEAHVETTVRWTDSRAFLLRSFVVQPPKDRPGGEGHQGTQIIGWDPRSHEIRSWTFNSDGSFGDATWSKNGDDWLIKSSQTLPDGQAASGTFALTRVDDNTISLRLMGHEVEGEPQPAGKSVTVVRVVEDKKPPQPQPKNEPTEKKE